ncbi:MAG: hydantoinase/oxoprolinase family protein [Desulfobacterales bacterium]|nr:hydantoinase/oxoprolinase family protein [Desulfobacterales bacterium]
MYKIGIDVGGTHTDGVLVAPGGAIHIAKAETTPGNLSEGVLNCCAKLGRHVSEDLDQFLSKVELILHGTTVGTNAVLQAKDPKVGSVVTDGFRDIVEMRRGARDTLYNLKVEFPQPLSPRFLRIPVKERVSYEGKQLLALDEDACRQAARTLRQKGATAVAVTFLFSFLDPTHERRARELILEEWPEAYVSLSSDVLSQIGEFERFSATVVDAFIAPYMGHYLNDLKKQLAARGFKGRLFIGQCNGSIVPPEIVLNRPVWTINSGPAAAAPATRYYGELFGTGNVISADMGGTSFDVLLIINNEAQVTTEGWVGPYRLAVPQVKVTSIGGGGGSIAWLDASGIIQVGPASAGAVPGPACYGKGGVEPTVTDADLVLGYLNPDNFLGGERTLDVKKAEQAIKKIADPLKLSVDEAAGGIIRILVQNSVQAIRRECLDRGADVRDFILLAGGGAGPTHAGLIARELEIPQIVVPMMAPGFCAFGWLRSDMVIDFVRSKVMLSGNIDYDLLNKLYEEMEKGAREELGEDIQLKRTVDARYCGQFRETEIAMPDGKLGHHSTGEIKDNFHRRHKELFHFDVQEMELEFINYRVKALLKTDKPRLGKTKGPEGGQGPRIVGERMCVFGGKRHKTQIVDGSSLRAGDEIQGPAVVEQTLTSLLVPLGFNCKVDMYGNFVLTIRS